MRVLHIQKVKGIGGSERHLLSLLPGLEKAGIDARICVLGTADYARFVRPLRQQGVETVVLPAGPHANLALTAKLLTQIRSWRPSIVHTHLIHADLYGQLAARIARRPGVSSIHEASPHLRTEPFRSMFRMAHHSARRTVAISNHVSAFIARHRLAPLERVRVVPYGIEVSAWTLAESERGSSRRRFGLKPAEVVIGVASRFVRGKGHAVVLAAMSRVVERVPDARLVLAGDGPAREELERRARRLPEGIVRFVGHVDDVKAFMNACDVVVFPTLPELGEGFGLAALEAMAAARPVIASGVASLPEVVADGETGFLVPPGDPGQLADRLVELCSDVALRKRLGERGRSVAERVFGLGDMVERTVAVYREIV